MALIGVTGKTYAVHHIWWQYMVAMVRYATLTHPTVTDRSFA